MPSRCRPSGRLGERELHAGTGATRVHELSLCRALLKLVEPIALQHAAPVVRVVLRVGPLSGAEPELLMRAFPQAAAGTCADGAQLDLQLTPLRISCLVCGAESDAAVNRLACTVCGATRTRLLSGDELDLLRVELHPLEANESHV
ncbi:MAG TPA: hydrogenase maturation nickel metallochaperone HypA [Acetobacteraceae bacterium]|nr:hydrogenase maturation nickel metallochaperone HypA [Acetobacteraceae bacterium]